MTNREMLEEVGRVVGLDLVAAACGEKGFRTQSCNNHYSSQQQYLDDDAVKNGTNTAIQTAFGWWRAPGRDAWQDIYMLLARCSSVEQVRELAQQIKEIYQVALLAKI